MVSTEIFLELALKLIGTSERNLASGKPRITAQAFNRILISAAGSKIKNLFTSNASTVIQRVCVEPALSFLSRMCLSSERIKMCLFTSAL